MKTTEKKVKIIFESHTTVDDKGNIKSETKFDGNINELVDGVMKLVNNVSEQLLKNAVREYPFNKP